ncbi:Monothiol glutaredoxin-S2 [Forsythia ovata]|uniref:Monothiol glutaredoxin-S2 n=1 Tax=Forsythia ovata TaxID=205694 RepID=A0ABD1WTF5_9LAMI
MDVVMRLWAENLTFILNKNSCCISHAIKMLIRSFGANPTIYELDELSNRDQMEKALLVLGYNPSIPIVFIGKKFIGSSNEIMSLNVKGEFMPLLINANAIWI